MTRQLTALILALLIGSPLCCCSWSHRAESTIKACCQTKKHGDSQKPKDKENCPCANTPKVRAMVDAKVSVPGHDVSPSLITNQVVELKVPVWSDFQSTLAPNEHGPPRDGVPLYLRHCALLM
jgi:hypothetical protein